MMITDRQKECYGTLIESGYLANAWMFDCDGKPDALLASPWQKVDTATTSNRELQKYCETCRETYAAACAHAEKVTPFVRLYNGAPSEDDVLACTVNSEGWEKVVSLQREMAVITAQTLVRNKSGQEAVDAIDWVDAIRSKKSRGRRFMAA
jgi:hypothetical protein